MKKFLIIAGLLLTATNVFAQSQGQYTYTPEYIQHLKSCAPYTDEYKTKIPTGDENSPYLEVKSTEEILGYLNGKCYTLSTVYSYDIDQTILKIKCGLTKNQIAQIAKKMQQVNSEKSPEAKEALKTYTVNLIENKDFCKVKNYLEENK